MLTQGAFRARPLSAVELLTSPPARRCGKSSAMFPLSDGQNEVDDQIAVKHVSVQDRVTQMVLTDLLSIESVHP